MRPAPALACTDPETVSLDRSPPTCYERGCEEANEAEMPAVRAGPELLERYALVLSVGHDEYWSVRLAML